MRPESGRGGASGHAAGQGPRLAALLVVFWVACLCVHASDARASDEAIQAADTLRWSGRYTEAIASYRPLSVERSEAAIGLARCLVETGRREEAAQVLGQAVESFPDDAGPRSWQAWLQLQAGDLKASRESAAAALERDDSAPLARWVLAECDRQQGRLEEAQEGYEWFIDFYNRQPPADADSLLWVGRAAAQYARWTGNSQQFKFLVNQLYPDALQAEPLCWPARLEMARLFLEKYNQRQATVELSAALALNSQAAEVYACRAEHAVQTFDLPTAQRNVEQALRINSQLVQAYQVQADIDFALLQPLDAEEDLERARRLCPIDEHTLGRLVAARLARHVDAQDDGAQARESARQLIDECTARNSHCGILHLAAGKSFDLMRRYPQAATSFEQAQDRMPQLVQAPGELGLVYMRLGREEEGRQQLETAFQRDPFNARVKNMLEVLDLLQGYAVLTTEHFVIRFDRGQDAVLARYVADYLEQQVYPEVCREMGYEPEGKTLFEIFSRAKNTSGHGWFSARTVGLPYIGTVAACAGRIVAMTSPSDLDEPYHWGRVLKHEFIHVVNLQQTDFNIPHWYTEALAVRSEQLPRPALWDEVLSQRLAADDLFDLETINLGFVRPKDQRDWTLAYCQAELYAEYMVEAYGDDALKRMLNAYAQQRSTPAALRECFDVSVEQFEQGYRKFLEGVVAKIPPSVRKVSSPPGLGDLHQALDDNPDDPSVLAQLATAYLDRKDNASARKYADRAIAIEPKQAEARYVLARLYLSIGDTAQALGELEAGWNADDPHEKVLLLLASFAVRKQDFAEAERLYRLGEQHLPHPDRWLKALAQVYLRSRQQARLTSVLERLAAQDHDNLLLRKKLAQLAAAEGRFEDARKWAHEGILIDVTDAELHRQLARAAAQLKQNETALDEYATAIELEPRRPGWRFEYADLLAQQGKPEEARTQLEELLRIRPDFPGADVLLESLDP